MTAAGAKAGTKRSWESLTEAAVVFLAIMLYIWKFRMVYPTSYLVILGYVLGSHFAHGESLRRLGFGWREARAAFPQVFVWTIAAAVSILLIGAAAGTLRPARPAHVVAGIAAYILWGLFQQYLLNGYFVNRLLEFSHDSRGRFAPLGGALLFAAAHLPNWFLVAVTFAGGYLAARVYLKYRSLYPLAVAHGLIGYVLLRITPDWIAAGFLIGPRYLLQMYGTYPEILLF